MTGKKYLPYLLGILPAVWLALLIAPSVSGGLPGIIAAFPVVMNTPFHIVWCEDSLMTVLIFVSAYGLGIGIYLSTKRSYRRGEEHGSAQWGDAMAVNRKYQAKPPKPNKIFTQNVRMGLNGKKHRRNLNTVIVGGSGAGKTRFYAKANLYEAAESSYVCLDPKGELLRDAGNLLLAKGYEVRVLDLLNMQKSHCYNPFVYLRDDNDVQRLVTNLFKSTTPKGSQSNDPFWDTAASMLLMALVFFLHYEAPPDEQNFPMVMEMLRAGEVREDDDSYESPLDILFERLEMRSPEHIAVKYYRDYHSGSAKTLKSIQITLAARLEKFNLSSLTALTATDELDLPSLGEKKVALFALIPDNDTSFNFLVSILYTQLFQQLFYLADHKYGGSLPVPVHFLMDEFANVSLPEDFDKILSVMRSRNVFVSIILQNIAQLKALFEKQWESIIGNCDEFLYLGGNEQSTHKYVSELLGKSTIDTNTYGRSFGHNGNYSTNYQISGRELLTADEVRMLDNRQALLFIRGERPIRDAKYDILRHPNVALTPDGGGKPYLHGGTENAVAILELHRVPASDTPEPEQTETVYELLSNEEMEAIFLNDYELEKQRSEMKEFLDDLTSRDQRMMFANLTFVHTADTKEQLDQDTQYIQTAARQRMCQMAVMRFQQLDGMNTALPIGVRKVHALRTLTTESLAVLMPFRVQEIMDTGGIYYGENAISGNLILCNLANLLNQSAIVLGVPGSGKSFSAKELIVFLALATDDDILICDPEREYVPLGKALGAETIRIAAGSADHINALDMVEGYGDGGNPIIDKSEFVLSLFEQLDPNGINPKQKSIIDRCVEAVYADYTHGGAVPTLCVLREKLLSQPEEEAKELALSLELFTSGSLNAFAHETNVNVHSRMVIYDIMDLGRQLKTMGLLVITDAMLNRVTENWRKGKRTHLFIDEFHVVFENEHSAEFFNSAWRRFRKRNAYPCALTQNVEYLLDSVQASTMLSNSEFLIILNQAASDREKLAQLLNISPEQLSYITNAPAGCGLIRYGGALVPFKNQFPKDTELYRLMTTKPGEGGDFGGDDGWNP